MKTMQTIDATLNINLYTRSELKESGLKKRMEKALEEAFDDFLLTEDIEPENMHPCMLDDLDIQEVEDDED